MKKHEEEIGMLIPGIIGVALIVYLTYVLIKPEKF
ncbi:K(+)-transporting ATPase subunit F [Neobacillus cucumis]|nr:K(+)-transporting ATPase subunit F [Bacillus salipaludis]MBI0579687.1 K(+)-transporting ATPase subunit F [Neobacillus cucumis]MCM2534905.1 K(+)-transporting ATPase subunit F [Neobacillus pocheonensis]MED1469213.1 K(+)-transporting ATPase subunit F [Bacillus salipaludis]